MARSYAARPGRGLGAGRTSAERAKGAVAIRGKADGTNLKGSQDGYSESALFAAVHRRRLNATSPTGLKAGLGEREIGSLVRPRAVLVVVAAIGPYAKGRSRSERWRGRGLSTIKVRELVLIVESLGGSWVSLGKATALPCRRQSDISGGAPTQHIAPAGSEACEVELTTHKVLRPGGYLTVVVRILGDTP